MCASGYATCSRNLGWEGKGREGSRAAHHIIQKRLWLLDSCKQRCQIGPDFPSNLATFRLTLASHHLSYNLLFRSPWLVASYLASAYCTSTRLSGQSSGEGKRERFLLLRGGFYGVRPCVRRGCKGRFILDLEEDAFSVKLVPRFDLPYPPSPPPPPPPHLALR